MGVIAKSIPSTSATLKITSHSSGLEGLGKDDIRTDGKPFGPLAAGTPRGRPGESRRSTRSTTLTNAPSPSSRVDAESETEIVTRLDRINSLVEEVSLLADDWDTFRPRQSWKPLSAADKKTLKSVVHPAIIGHLDGASMADSFSESLLRYAWETIICRSAYVVLVPFALVNPQKEYSLIKRAPTSKIAREAEAQQQRSPNEYAHWRSNRHKQLRTSIAEDSQRAKLQSLCRTASALCYSCACLLNQPNLPDRPAFLRTLESRVIQVLAASVDLTIIIHEGILSQEFALDCPFSGTSVDPSKVTLEEGVRIESKSVDTILGVTELGIHSTALSSAATPPPTRYLRRAKVVSERVLSQLRKITGRSPDLAPQSHPIPKVRSDQGPKDILPSSNTTPLLGAPKTRPKRSLLSMLFCMPKRGAFSD